MCRLVSDKIIDHIWVVYIVCAFFFFFKQKTAYEIASCLVGSEMCIRDRTTRVSNFSNSSKEIVGLIGLAL